MVLSENPIDILIFLDAVFVIANGPFYQVMQFIRTLYRVRYTRQLLNSAVRMDKHLGYKISKSTC